MYKCDMWTFRTKCVHSALVIFSCHAIISLRYVFAIRMPIFDCEKKRHRDRGFYITGILSLFVSAQNPAEDAAVWREYMEPERTTPQNRYNQNMNPRQNTIDLVEVFSLLFHYLWLIVIVGAACAVGAYCVSRFLLPKEYQSTTSVYIIDRSDNSQTTYNDLQAGAQLTNDYAELIRGDYVINETIRELGLPDTYDRLRDRVTVTVPDNTRLVFITVTDYDPKQAQKIADTIREVSAQHITEVMQIDAVNVDAKATLPVKPSAPHNGRNAVVTALIGILLTCAVVIVRYLLDDTVKTPDDIQKYVQLSTLAVVPMNRGLSAEEKKILRRETPPRKTREEDGNPGGRHSAESRSDGGSARTAERRAQRTAKRAVQPEDLGYDENDTWEDDTETGHADPDHLQFVDIGENGDRE